jgi:hypothetical protein
MKARSFLVAKKVFVIVETVYVAFTVCDEQFGNFSHKNGL